MPIDKTFLLVILDGWGYNKITSRYNASYLAETPCFDSLWRLYSNTLLSASGEDVGLPAGQMGNSEVGHMTIGCGRVIEQDLQRINKAIDNNQIVNNDAMLKLLHNAKARNSSVHIIGLLSDGGVHSHINHIEHIMTILDDHNVDNILHAVTDGRDVLPKSVAKYIESPQIQKKIMTLTGRYYAMDRDNRWERTSAAVDAIMNVKQDNRFSDLNNLINQMYQENITDEFFSPSINNSYQGIKENDIVIIANFRADRVKQITQMLIEKYQNDFNHNLSIFTMTDYGLTIDDNIGAVLFPPNKIKNSLAEYLSKEGLKQLYIAETEKYPHVTYFFNGGVEKQYEGVDRQMIPSPKVKTYDLCPEMSAYDITEKTCQALLSNKYDFICVNFANADMVGHTGNIIAAIHACEALDLCLKKIVTTIKQSDDYLFITADHGNVEEMFDEINQQPHTAHTCNKVPFIYIGPDNHFLQSGSLADVAPTILEKMNLTKPSEMTGSSLFLNFSFK